MSEYKGKFLACLVPKEGKSGITSHEKTLCDCEVIEILSELEKTRKICLELQERYSEVLGKLDSAEYIIKEFNE